MLKRNFSLIALFVFAFLFVLSLGTASACIEYDSGYVINEAIVDLNGNYTYTLSTINKDGLLRKQIITFPADAMPSNVLIDNDGNYIVTERGTETSGTHNLSKVTPSGTRTVIYKFADGTYAHQAAMDGNGNFIVTESMTDTLSSITPGGVRSVIYKFTANSRPLGVAIDSNGDYIVSEGGVRGDNSYPCTLSKITKDGVRSVIYNFIPGTLPQFVAIDNNGDYIVSEAVAGKISRVTQAGVRTVLSDVSDLIKILPIDSAIEPEAVAVEANGDIIFAVPLAGSMYRLTTDGVRTQIYFAIPVPTTFAIFPLVKESVVTMNPVSNVSSLCPYYVFVPVFIKPNAVSSTGAAVTLSATVSCNDSSAKIWTDWTKPVIDNISGIVSLSLRSVPPKNSVERKYTISITATDANGGSASQNVILTAPKKCSILP